MVWLRSALFNVLFISWTLTLGVLAFPALLFPRSAMAVSSLWMDVTFAMLRIICGVRVVVEGVEHIPNMPVIFAAKHQSAWETLYLWRMLDNPAFILKKELIQIPIFGWYLARSKPISINRKAGKQAMRQVLEQGKQRLAAGRSIVIFPEGTRTKPGATKPYKKGVFALAEATGAQVIPVAHNAGQCWPRNSFRKYAGTITLRFLAPVEAKQLTPSDLQEALEAASHSLLT